MMETKCISYNDKAVNSCSLPPKYAKGEGPCGRLRTLHDFPMDHNKEDSTRLYQSRREANLRFKEGVESSVEESRCLSSFGKRRFDVAISPNCSKASTPITPEEKCLFSKECRPKWMSWRSCSTISFEDKQTRIKDMETRPESVPTLTLSRETVRSKLYLQDRPFSQPVYRSTEFRSKDFVFNHMRGSAKWTKPNIKKLIRDYNETHKVCSPEENMKGSIDWKDLTLERKYPETLNRTASDVKELVSEKIEPVDLDKQQEEGEEIDEEIDNNGEEEIKKLPDEVGLTDVLERATDKKERFSKTESTIAETKRNSLQGKEEELVNKETLKSEHTVLSPVKTPPSCWVDAVTVSSMGDDHQELDDHVVEAQHKKFSENTFEKQESDDHKLDTPLKQEKSKTFENSATRDTKVSEKPPAILPETLPVQENILEQREEEEQGEDEVEIILPGYICPSSAEKSIQRETQIWLQKSPFMSANRTVPIL